MDLCTIHATFADRTAISPYDVAKRRAQDGRFGCVAMAEDAFDEEQAHIDLYIKHIAKLRDLPTHTQREVCINLKEIAAGPAKVRIFKADGGSNRQLEVRTAVRTSSVRRVKFKTAHFGSKT